MNYFSCGFINYVNLCFIGMVSEGEVDNEVFFCGSIEESENVWGIYLGRCIVFVFVCDINVVNLINFW